MDSDSLSSPSGSGVSSWQLIIAEKPNEATNIDPFPLNINGFKDVPDVDPKTYSIATQAGHNSYVVTRLFAGIGNPGCAQRHLTSCVPVINQKTIVPQHYQLRM